MKVLQVFGEPLSNGGQEAFIMNIYRNINKKKVEFDFFSPYYCDNENLKKEIENLGGRVFLGNGTFGDKNSKKTFKRKLKLFLKNNKYDVIHIHSGSLYALTYGAKIAKKSGASRVIVHAHAAGLNNIKYKIIKFISNFIITKYATEFIACSDYVAKWKFPNKIIKQKKYYVVKNGIQLNNFEFSQEIREEYRKKLNIEKKFAIVHIGRFAEEKNHTFLIDVFKEIYKKDNNSVLVLVGTGELEDEIKNKVEKLNINKSVIFLKNRNDVNKILQAMDIFVFPSLYEGLGIVAIEAQASGLVTICSDKVPDEVNITDLYKCIEIEKGASMWADEILKYKKCDRVNCISKIKEEGYDAIQSANKLEDIYLKQGGIR